MKQRKVAINLVSANVFSIVLMIGAAIVFCVPFFLIWGGSFSMSFLFDSPWTPLWVFLGLIVGIVVHELIHGITWSFFAPSGWHSISFGVMWKMLTPYCHCDEPMRRHAYLWGAMMPCIVLGIIPAIVSLFTGSVLLLLWGIFFIAAAAGDIWMSWLLLKEKPNCLVLDHPSEAGFYVYDEE